MMTKTASDYMTSPELAHLLRVSLRFIEKNRRCIPGAAKIGRVWRFRRYEIERAIDNGELIHSFEGKE